MKLVFLISFSLLSIVGHTCALKDYDCIKQQVYDRYSATQQQAYRTQKTYNYNQKIYLSGRYNSSPVQLDGYSNHNVHIRAHNTNVNTTDGTASLVTIQPSGDKSRNSVSVNASGVIKNTTKNMLSSEVCTALVCNRGTDSSGITINIRNANVTNTIK